jgi:uncharacterized protein
MSISNLIALKTSLPNHKVDAALNLFEQGATLPFIARYRKEATGGLDEIQLTEILAQKKYFDQVEARKKTILKQIEEQDKLTEKLKDEISNCFDLNVLEDIYLPFKPRKETKADKALALGLKPLASAIYKGEQNPLIYAEKFVGASIGSPENAITLALDIVALWISEHLAFRENYRRLLERKSKLTAKVKRGKTEEAEHFKDYLNYSEPAFRAPSHRVLAVFRGQNEGLLNVSLTVEPNEVTGLYSRFFAKNDSEWFQMAFDDAIKRLVHPSIEKEILNQLKEKADKAAVVVFAKNLEQLLLGTPLGNKRVLAIDPGFRTGCKVVVLNEQGDLLHNETIYPHPPQNKFSMAASQVRKMLEAYKIEAIAIGNGTAGKETEFFIKKVGVPEGVRVYVVREEGASVYSASKLAREEFPNYDVTVRGAVSIGRRLMDPLAELVKIEPKALGVGQYQHDINQNYLEESLTQIVELCVNRVGVNLNSASKHLLAYVAGIGPSTAEKIVDFRTKNGAFSSREQLLKVKGFGAKSFEQAAGFLRIPNTENELENTGVHPESYALLNQVLKQHKLNLKSVIGNKEEIEKLKLKLGSTLKENYTLNDILSELEKPGHDPRKIIKVIKFNENIKSINDLSVGMIVPGIVNNITAFGAFVDIGIKASGLVHLSQLADEFISNPHQVVSLNEHVKVKVISVEPDKNRFALTMKPSEMK